MFACAFIPDFSIQALTLHNRDMRGKAIVVLEGKPPLQKVVAANEQAAQSGIEIGLTKVQAQLRLPDANFCERSAHQELATQEVLLDCAATVSPVIEATAIDTVLLDISGAGRLLGNHFSIANKLQRSLRQRGLAAQIGVAQFSDCATFAARGFTGIKIVPSGREGEYLSGLLIELLPCEPSMLRTLHRWGVRTFRQFAKLPTVALSERLGQEGLQLQELARGTRARVLKPYELPSVFQAEMELEHPVELLESLEFVLAELLDRVCSRLSARSHSTNCLHLWMELEKQESAAKIYERDIRFPIPMLNTKIFAQLLHLALEANPPTAAVLKVRLSADAVRPRFAQEGLFMPIAPEPERLELTLARMSGIMGENKVGAVKALDTHRPDSFTVERFHVPASSKTNAAVRTNRLPLRRLRPPLSASVTLRDGTPQRLLCRELHSTPVNIVTASGPWRSSGDWWSEQVWKRDEWDITIQLEQATALYRIFQDLVSLRWFVAASYD